MPIMPPPLQDQSQKEYDSKIHIISLIKQHGENCAFYHKSSGIKYKHTSQNIIAERTKYFDNTKNNTKIRCTDHSYTISGLLCNKMNTEVKNKNKKVQLLPKYLLLWGVGEEESCLSLELAGNFTKSRTIFIGPTATQRQWHHFVLTKKEPKRQVINNYYNMSLWIQ